MATKTWSELKASGDIYDVTTGTDPNEGEYITYKCKQYSGQDGAALADVTVLTKKADLENQKTSAQTNLDGNIQPQLDEFS